MSTVNEVLRWKERRTLLPVWVSMGALFLCGLLLVSMSKIGGSNDIHAESFFALFWLSCCVIGLATGIMMFVPEREQETDLLLGRFPVQGRIVSRIKLIEASRVFCTFVIVTGFLVVAAFWLRHGDFLFNKIRWDQFLMLSFVPVQTFLWSCLCSLFFRHSLKAVVFAAGLTAIGWFTTSIGSLLIVELFQHLPEGRDVFYVVGGNCLAVSLLVFSILRLSSTWLRGVDDSAPARKVSIRNSLDLAVYAKRHSTSYSAKSLMWQGWRLNWLSLLVLTVGLMIWSGVASSVFLYRYGRMDVFGVYRTLLAVCSVSGAFAGLAIFRGDQSKNGFLFFQQHANYPTRVWLSRVALLGIVIPFVLISATWIANSGRIPGNMDVVAGHDVSLRNLFLQTTTWNGIIIFLTIASIAQLISITCRSGILAFFFTFAVAFVVSSWCATILEAGEALLIFAAPVILSCFVASWWYTPRWISQRKPIRSIAIPLVVVALVFVASSVAYVGNRIGVHVPKIDLAYQKAFESNDDFMNADKDRFASVFQIKEAAAELSFDSLRKEQGELPMEEQGDYQRWPSAMIEKFVDSNKDALTKIEEAVSHDLVYHWLTPKSLNERHSQYNLIAEPLSIHSEYFTREKDVGKLLDSLTAEIRAAWRLNPRPGLQTARMILELCRWAEMEGQSDESLRSGHAKLERLRFEIFNPSSERVQHEVYYGIERKFRDAQPDPNFLLGVLSEGPSYWERIREHRIKLRDFSGFVQSLPERIRNPKYFPQGSWIHSFEGSFSDGPYGQSSGCDARSIDRAISYASLRIALQVWRLEHGTYPKSLDELTHGGKKVLDELPNDPLYGVPFAYFPDGLDAPAFLPNATAFGRSVGSGYQVVFDSSNSIPANRPFLLPFAGGFNSESMYVGERESEAAKFQKSYKYVHPSEQLGSLVEDSFSLKHPHDVDFLLPVKKAGSEAAQESMR